jgi:high-affinity Fe2+/Pb2+ permease
MGGGSRTVARIVVLLVLVVCAVLIVNGIQQAQAGNPGSLITLIIGGVLGFALVWFRSRT